MLEILDDKLTVMQCPRHGGSFDCTPFCNLCEGNQELSFEELMKHAEGIAWDTCHKIYILLDYKQVIQMREYQYDPLLTELSLDRKIETVLDWYGQSCGLRFISAVETGNDNEPIFYDIIAQGEEWPTDEDEDEDDDEY